MAREFVATFKSLGAEKLQRDFNGIAKSTGTLDKGLDKVNGTSVRTQRRMSELAVSLKGLAAAGAGLAVGRFLTDAVSGAASAETSLRGISSVLGEVATNDIVKWAEENGDALNLSKEASIEASKGFVVYAKSIADAGGDSAKFTADMVRLTAELAAFKGVDPGEVIDSMAAALRGEFDPLEKFGVALTAAQVQAEAVKEGLVGVGDVLTQQQKAVATYALLMEQGAFAMGSVARNADTLPGQMADLREKTDNLANSVGTALLPALTGLAEAANTLFDAFNKLPGPIKVLVSSFLGLTILKKLVGNSLTPVTQSLTNLRTSLAQTSGAVGKFSGAMRGIIGAFNPWTLAITGAITLATLWISKQQKAKAAAEEWASGIDTVTGALNEQGQALLVDKLKDYVDEADKAGIAAADLAAAVGDTRAYDALIAKLQDVADANVSSSRSLGPNGGVAQTYNEQGQAALDLVRQLRTLRGEYQDGLEINKATKRAQDGVASSLNAGADAADAQAQKMADLQKAVKDSADAYQDLLDNFTAVNQAMVDSRSTIFDYQGALDDLAKSLHEGGGTFSPDTEKGRTNWDSLVKVAETASDRISSTLERRGTDAAQQVYRNSRNTLHSMLVNAGVQTGRAWELVDQVLKKPHKMEVVLDQASIAKARKDLARLRERKQEIKAEFAITTPGSANAAERVGREMQKKLAPIQARIDTQLEKLKPAKDDLDQAANPDGKPRKAKIVPTLDPAQTLAIEHTLARLTATETKIIKVHFEENPTGASLDPTAFLGVPLSTTQKVTVAAPPAGPAPLPTIRELTPKRTPVAVYLDGVEIAHRIEARRAMAATESVRRSA